MFKVTPQFIDEVIKLLPLTDEGYFLKNNLQEQLYTLGSDLTEKFNSFNNNEASKTEHQNEPLRLRLRFAQFIDENEFYVSANTLNYLESVILNKEIVKSFNFNSPKHDQELFTLFAVSLDFENINDMMQYLFEYQNFLIDVLGEEVITKEDPFLDLMEINKKTEVPQDYAFCAMDSKLFNKALLFSLLTSQDDYRLTFAFDSAIRKHIEDIM